MEWFVLMLFVALLYGVRAIIEKKTLFKEHAMEFSAVFCLFMALASLTLIPVLDFSFPWEYWVYMVIESWVSAVGLLYVAKAIRHMQISSASPLFSFGPVMTALLAFIFLGEKLSLIQMGGIALIIAGSYVLELKKQKSLSQDLIHPFKTLYKSRYVHFMMFALFLHAIGGLITRFLLGGEKTPPMEPLTYAFIIHILIALNLFILITVLHDGAKGIKHGITNAWKPILLVTLFAFIGRLALFYVISLPTAKIGLVVALQRTSLIVATFFGGGFFHEENLKQKTIAAVIMLVGAALITM